MVFCIDKWVMLESFTLKYIVFPKNMPETGTQKTIPINKTDRNTTQSREGISKRNLILCTWLKCRCPSWNGSWSRLPSK